MGVLISRNKGHETKLDDEICPYLPNHTGKFLFQSISNVGNDLDGGGGTYLSCKSDGSLCGNLTENDPELWRILYQESTTKHLLFRILNTSVKLYIVADLSNQVSTNTTVSSFENKKRSDLFYLIRGNTSEGTYYIRTNFQTYLSQCANGTVSLSTFDDGDNDMKWKLMPSF